MRSYTPEPDRGERKWKGKAAEKKAVYGNRRRVRGRHGKRLIKRRGEYIERSFAHLCETGAMRRTHLRGRDNIRKRLLIHASGFNLSLVMRKNFRVGTPRGLQGRNTTLFSSLGVLVGRSRRFQRRLLHHPVGGLMLRAVKFFATQATGLNPAIFESAKMATFATGW